MNQYLIITNEWKIGGNVQVVRRKTRSLAVMQGRGLVLPRRSPFSNGLRSPEVTDCIAVQLHRPSFGVISANLCCTLMVAIIAL